MGVSRFQAEAEWDRAVQEAARLFRKDRPEASVFHEFRDDWRVTIASGRLVERVHTHSAGVRFEPGDSREPVFWVASPTREDLVRLGGARSIPFRSEGDDPGRASSDDPLAPVACLDLREETGEIRLDAAAFRQTVRVGLPDGTVRRDVREGARVRIGTVPDARGRRGFGASDVVLRSDPDREIRAAVARAMERARARVGASSIASHVTRAVFAPGVGGLLIHEMVGHALEGDVLARGGSWLGGDGARAGPAEMNVIDDPTRGRGAWRFDDDGVEARPTVLVRDGRVAGALLDRASGRALGHPPTGHGRRATFRDPILPRMGATFLDAGEDEDGAAVADTARGVYILRMSGGRSDPATGTATFRVTDADAIDQGRRTHPVQPFVFVVSASRSPLQIDRIAKEVAFDSCIGSCHRAGQPLSTSVGAPTFRLGSIEIIPSLPETS